MDAVSLVYIIGFAAVGIPLLILWLVVTPETLLKWKFDFLVDEDSRKQYDYDYDKLDYAHPLLVIFFISFLWFVLLPIFIFCYICYFLWYLLNKLRDIIQQNHTEEKIRNFFSKEINIRFKKY